MPNNLINELYRKVHALENRVQTLESEQTNLIKFLSTTPPAGGPWRPGPGGAEVPPTEDVPPVDKGDWA
jgi:hypothetical protein